MSDADDTGPATGERPRPRPRPSRPAVDTPVTARANGVPIDGELPSDLADDEQLTPPPGDSGGRHRAGATSSTPAAPAARPTPRPGRVIATAPAPDPMDAAMTRFIAASEPQPEDDEPNEAEKPERRTGGRWRRWRGTLVRTVIVLVVAGVVALLLRAFVVEPYYIPSESMEPTLHGCTGCTEDHVLVDKLSYDFQSVKAGQIVVFHKPPNAAVPDDVLIKRVIAVGGDRVQLRKDSAGQWDGKVYVNGLALDESYVNPKCGSRPSLPLTTTTSWTIPSGDLFVMGDNRCESLDSRAFGPIKDSSVIGKAVLIVWPLSRFGGIS